MRTQLISLLLLGCGDPRPIRPDALPRCGDGTVDVVLEDPANSEQCDDGAATGTEGSLCTAFCKDARVRWVPLDGQTQLPFPARKLVALPGHLIISNFDDDGIGVVPIGNVGVTLRLKKYSAPVSFEVQGANRIVWIERAIQGVGGPWLLWYQLGDPATAIREIPYPFTSARGGIFVLAENVGPNGFIDVDSNEHLHRVMVSNLEQPIVADADLGPVTGNLLMARRNTTGEELAIFLSTADQTNVLIADEYPAPTLLRTVMWRRTVVHAAAGFFLRSDIASDQLALLDPEGSVDVWSFRGPLAELTDSLFGHAPQGSQRIVVTQSQDVLSVSPKGEIVALKNNGLGRSLAPQEFPVGVACAVCSIAETSGSPEWFAFDTLAVHGLIAASPQ